MARTNRRDLFDPCEVSVLHCCQRAVRRAMLCGQDPVSGRDYEHRREWIRDRLEFLAGAFGIDVLSFSIMHNHLHVILRNRPDIVETWSDLEVARRWWNIFPQRRDQDGSPAEPQPHELKMLIASEKKTKELRRRLSDVSWFMKCLAEPIARRANREDECTGHFWEGRFKCQKLADEAALLACSVYVDLNPVRAAIASTPEGSDYTSVQERIEAELETADAPVRTRPRRARRFRNRSPLRRPASWLSPVELESRGRPGPKPAREPVRASDKGFLPMSVAKYLELVDWTGRQLKRAKRGAIPAELAPILERVGLSGEVFLSWVSRFKRSFRRVVGTPASLLDEAKRMNRAWLQSPGAKLLAVN